MHSEEEIRYEFQRLDRILGVDSSGIEIAFSPRAVYQYGCCRYRRENGKMVPVQIRIASFLQNEEDAFWETVRHEYAHAAAVLLTGENAGHGPVWQEICRKIGINPSRLAQACPAQKKAKEQRIKFEIVCLSCGARYAKMRRSRFTNAVVKSKGKPVPYRCACGGRRFQCVGIPPQEKSKQ